MVVSCENCGELWNTSGKVLHCSHCPSGSKPMKVYAIRVDNNIFESNEAPMLFKEQIKAFKFIADNEGIWKNHDGIPLDVQVISIEVS